jgi:hypothetical protein
MENQIETTEADENPTEAISPVLFNLRGASYKEDDLEARAYKPSLTIVEFTSSHIGMLLSQYAFEREMHLSLEEVQWLRLGNGSNNLYRELKAVQIAHAVNLRRSLYGSDDTIDKKLLGLVAAAADDGTDNYVLPVLTRLPYEVCLLTGGEYREMAILFRDNPSKALQRSVRLYGKRAQGFRSKSAGFLSRKRILLAPDSYAVHGTEWREYFELPRRQTKQSV